MPTFLSMNWQSRQAEAHFGPAILQFFSFSGLSTIQQAICKPVILRNLVFSGLVLHIFRTSRPAKWKELQVSGPTLQVFGTRWPAKRQNLLISRPPRHTQSTKISFIYILGFICTFWTKFWKICIKIAEFDCVAVECLNIALNSYTRARAWRGGGASDRRGRRT